MASPDGAKRLDRWSEATLGETFGPQDYELAPQLHDRFIGGVHNELAIHEGIVDPTVAGNFAIYLLGSRYPGPIIHTHQEIRAFAPVRVGQTVTATGELCLKEMRRGKAYVAIDVDFQRADDRVWWAKMTCIWPEVHLLGQEDE